MGVRRALARAATRRVHVLLVEAPGWQLLRIEAEAELARRGWPLAISPADADLLLMCGEDSGAWREVLQRLWEQMPSPRSRTVVRSPDALGGALEAARAELIDNQQQRRDVEQRLAANAEQHHDEHGVMDHEGMDHGDMDHGGMDHGGMDHGGMDHGGMDLPMPGGIPLAMGGQDRDGLDLDELHVRLGPVLPYWPAGLVAHCVLQGDVVVAAEVDVLSPDEVLEAATVQWRESAVRSCDAVGRLLGAAGWTTAEADAVSIRNGLLRDEDPQRWVTPLARLERRVLGSGWLRWSLRGVPAIGVAGAHSTVLAELGYRLASARVSVSERRADARPPCGRQDAAVLAELITGVELAEAQLIVLASVPETTAWARVAHE